MTQPEPTRAATADARDLTTEQVTAVLKVVDAILETAPKERPPHWSEVDDRVYGPYMNGKEYMLYDIAVMLRKALAPRPGDGDPAGE